MSSTELAIRDEAKVDLIQRIATECRLVNVTDANAWKNTFTLAEGMRQLREALNDEIMRDLMTLQGSPLGFRVDKDYPVETVRDVIIEAVIRGYRPVGNEFNIIGRNFYATQQGLYRKVVEWPGLTDLRLSPGVPTSNDKGALVPYTSEWAVDGEIDSIECIDKKPDGQDERIAVRVNAGMGSDAILGKAKRKMLARIVERLQGSSEPEGDITDADTMRPKRASKSSVNKD